MNNEEYIFFKEVLQSQGIHLHVFEVPYENLNDFDNGLRGHLYTNYDYMEVERQLHKRCKTGYIYMVSDVFEVYYVILGSQNPDGTRTYMIAGPYLKNDGRPDAAKIAERNKLELYHATVLKEYYNSLPLGQDIESIVYTFIRHFVPGFSLHMEIQELEFGELHGNLDYYMEEETSMATELIEARYRQEDALLLAVEQGDQTKAALLLNEIGKHRIDVRNRDKLRDGQNMTLTLNVLLRKAVQRARVHPAHIDAVSASFARRIEVSRTESELGRITMEMLRKYCHLVQSYSLRGYSELVANIINYIEFNLQEPLGLGYLAEKFSVNASYLSGQFKRETSETLTNYLNQKRMQKSLVFLATTRLPVHEVAAKVGIYDENYFSRLFKRIHNMTPREYRDTIQKQYMDIDSGQ